MIPWAGNGTKLKKYLPTILYRGCTYSRTFLGRPLFGENLYFQTVFVRQKGRSLKTGSAGVLFLYTILLHLNAIFSRRDVYQ